AFSQRSPPKPKVRLRHLPNLNQPALTVLEVARIIAAQDRLASAFSEGISSENQSVGAKTPLLQRAGARTIRADVLLCKAYFSYRTALYFRGE
ncbi:hypothetical protein, partial [uncultured Microbulbifer sp.]|uniref:hypothetical protein n=1 Tax=uncultured Microbulbifer sp. TaxID=348147 RepID=UPI0026190AB2